MASNRVYIIEVYIETGERRSDIEARLTALALELRPSVGEVRVYSHDFVAGHEDIPLPTP